MNAVESVAKTINGARGGTLSQALDAISSKLEIHPALTDNTSYLRLLALGKPFETGYSLGRGTGGARRSSSRPG